MAWRVFSQRLLLAIPTLLGVSLLAFAFIRLVPGDPVLLMLGERGASPEAYAELRAKLGLDDSLVQQFFNFLTAALTGDLGESIVSRQSVWQEFWSRFPATLELGLAAILFAVALGVPLGVIAAIKRRTFWDYGLMGVSLVGYSLPIFWWGLLLILFFSMGLGWTPVAGRIGLEFDVPVRTGLMLVDVWFTEEPWETAKSALNHLVLPAVALGTIPLAAIARMTRSSLLEVLREDYIRTAEAKGLPYRVVVLRHALKNALVPLITVVGLMTGVVLTGAILTETIFSWPGIGKWMVNSVEARDYPVVQGGVLLTSVIVIFVNLTVDMLYLAVNPSLRDGK